jgi:hypothetical protein
MKSKIVKLAAVVTLMATSAIALAANSDCCAGIECCLNMLGCC